MLDNVAKIILTAEDQTGSALSAVQGKLNDIGTAAESMIPKLGTLGMTIAGIGAGVGLAVLKSQFDSVISSLASLDDAAARTGASVESLSALNAVARVGGHDLGLVENAAIRLSKALAGADDEAKGAGHALDVLGLKAEDLRGMETGAALKAVADAMAKFEDGAGKTALAMDLLGKSGAQAIPYLQDLAELGQLNAKATAAQAAMAEEYEKSIKKLTASKNELYKTITVAVLPALTDFVKELTVTSNEVNAVRAAAKDLAQDGSVTSWADTAASAAGHVIDVFDGVVRTVQITTRSFAGIAKDIETVVGVAATAVGSGFTAEGQAAIKRMLDERQNFVAAMNEDIDQILSKPMFSEKLNTRIQQRIERPDNYKAAVASVMEAYKDYSIEIKRQVMASLTEAFYEGSTKADLSYTSHVAKGLKDGNKQVSAAVDEFARIMDRINGKDVGLDPKYYEDLQTLFAGYKSGRLDLDQYRDSVAKLTNQQKFHKDAVEAQKKADEEAAKAMADYYKDWGKYLGGLDEAASKMEEQVSQFGMTSAAIARTSLARAEERLEIAKSNGVAEDYLGQLEREVDARRRIAEAASNLDVLEANKKAAEQAAQDWQKTVDDVGRALTDSIFRGGKDGWEQLKATIEATAIRATIQPIVTNAVGSALQAVGLGGQSGALSLMSTGSSLLGAGNLSNYVGALGYTQLGSMAGAFGSGFSATAGGASLTEAIAAYNAAGMGATAASLEAGAGLASSLGGAASTLSSVMSGLATAAPYLAAAMLAAQALGAFDGPTYHHGGAYLSDTSGNGYRGTDESIRGFGLSWGAYTSDRSAAYDEAMKSLSSGIATQVAADIGKFGGDASGIKIATRFASDNSDYSVGAYRVINNAGKVVFDLDKHYTADAQKGMEEFAADSTRALVAALKASDLSDEIDALFSTVDPAAASIDQLNKVLTDASTLATAFGATSEAALKAIGTSSLSAYASFQKMGDALRESAFAGKASIEQISAGLQQRFAAEVALITDINSMIKDSSAGFATSIRTVKLGVLDNEGKYSFLDAEAAKYKDMIGTLVDPAMIQDYANRLRGTLDQAWGTLTDEQKKASSDEFVTRYTQADDLVTSRLQAARQAVIDDQTQLVDKIKEAVTQGYKDAAAALSAAGEAIPKQIDVTVTLPVSSGGSEVGAEIYVSSPG